MFMNKKKTCCILLALSSVAFVLCGYCSVHAETHPLDLATSSVYVDAKADQIKRFAAQELQQHLSLITGKNIPLVHRLKAIKPGSFVFMVGVAEPNLKSTDKLAVEEARYLLDEKNARLYLFGDDFIASNRRQPKATSAYSRNRVGTLFAVYDFLNLELGVKWIKPGNDGITYKHQTELVMSRTNHRWVPRMLFRGWRTEAWDRNVQRRFNAKTPVVFRLTPDELAAKRTEELIWQRRLKFGRPNRPGYGHAFTKYWEKYGKQHPEWFALGKNGKRGVGSGQKADRLKLCVSNPELLDAIVAEWRAKWLKDKNYNVYNACPNDSRGYCRCKKCRALDAGNETDKKYAGLDGLDPEGIHQQQTKGDTFETEPKSDRYVYFWNELLKRARKFNPKAKLIVYIYSDYRYPPRRQILADGIICGFVPRFRDSVATTEKEWAEWKKQGMKEVFLRPNDFNDSVGMPMGNSKYIFDKFSLSKNYKLVGTDYDRAYNALDVELSGLAFYVLGQAFNHPEKSYDELADEFFSTFGDAKDEVEKYYRYWVKLFEQKRLAKVGKAGGFGGRGYLFNNLQEFYRPEDFIHGKKILQRALKKDLPPRIRKNIESIMLANEHSRLIYQAITTNKSQATTAEKTKAARALYDFRLANMDKISGSLTMFFGTEASFDDITGSRRYITDIPQGKLISLPVVWKFKIDEKNIGLKEQWQKLSWSTIEKTWQELAVNAIWERQNSYSTPALAKKLQKYDGIGWYALKLIKRPELKGKKVRLLFGAVDESCWVYLDGKELGKHLFIKPDDWKTSFSFPLDSDKLASKDQLLIVRVEDKLGAGGIWKEVVLQVME